MSQTCSHSQAKFNLQSYQLLANTAPLQGATLPPYPLTLPSSSLLVGWAGLGWTGFPLALLLMTGWYLTPPLPSRYSNPLTTAPLQGLILLSFGPFIDEMVTSEWISSWEPNVPALQILGASCLIAVGTNLSQFLCLGRFTATSFQVLGHAKTLLVLFGGWFFFHEQATYKQLGGMALAVAGMIMYGYFMSKGGVRTQPLSPQKDVS